MEVSKTCIVILLAVHLSHHLADCYHYWDRHAGVTAATAQNMDDLQLVLGPNYRYLITAYWMYLETNCDVIKFRMTEETRLGHMERFCAHLTNCPVLTNQQSCMVRMVVINIRLACCMSDRNTGDKRTRSESTFTPHPPTTGPTKDKDVLLNGQRTCNTGSVRPSRRIVGGTDARRGEFPWAAMMLHNGKRTCGCSILDSTHAMTAAHCFRDVKVGDRVEVFAGRHLTDLSETEKGQQRVFVSTFKIHDQYKRITTANDIAIMQFDTPLKWTDYVMPICLPPPGDSMADRCTVIGWGDTNMDDKVQTFPAVLQKVSLKTYTKDECLKTFRERASKEYDLDNFVINGTVCAANGLVGGKDACEADSGGPLLCIKGTRTSLAYFQFGIVSNGLHCGSPNDPGVYTDVVYHLDWIKKTVASLF